jgi:hypothetical protein
MVGSHKKHPPEVDILPEGIARPEYSGLAIQDDGLSQKNIHLRWTFFIFHEPL